MAITQNTTPGVSCDEQGLACQQCGHQLEETSAGEGDTGAIHAHVWCPHCQAGGCLSTNMPGRKHVVRRGRALRGDL